MLRELQSQAFLNNPVPTIAKMREQGPLVPVKIPILGKIWLTTTQAAAAHVLKDDKNFTMRKAGGKVVGLSWWMPRMLTRLTSNMLSADEPDHKRLRGFVDQAFHRREVLSLDNSVESLANEYARDLFNQNTETDLMTGFARKLPLAVICELLGLPKEDWPKFMNWAAGITTVTGVVSFLFGINKLKPLTRYIEDRIKLAKVESSSGLLQDLVDLNKEDPQMTDDELVAMVFLLLLAGHETTTHLISGSMLEFFRHPEQLEKLKTDRGLMDLAVEECLRFVSPVQGSKPRYVQTDCEIEGVKVSKGEVIMPFLVAANFDPAVFDAPERFDITRKPNRHIEFGAGIHFCLGHQLARLEMKHALNALLTTYPDLKPAVPISDIRWIERFGMRSLQALPVKA